MPFEIEKFKQATFERRTAEVQVPGLSAFFNKEEPAVLTVQNLTGEEVARARERVTQNAAISEMISKVISEKASSKIEGIQQALGLTDDVPEDLVYRIALAEFGICSVQFEQEDCVKLADTCPESFYSLTSKILELTGLGKIASGESTASGMTTGSTMH